MPTSEKNRSFQDTVVDSNLNARRTIGSLGRALSYQDASVEQICPLVDGRGNFDEAYPTAPSETKSIQAVFLLPVGISILNWFIKRHCSSEFRFAHGGLSFVPGAERRPRQLHLLRRQAAAEPVRQLKQPPPLTARCGAPRPQGLAGGEASAPAPAARSSSFGPSPTGVLLVSVYVRR